MDFRVVKEAPAQSQSVSSRGYLVRDKWDDWGEYETQFMLVIFDSNGVRHVIGEVKIGQIGLKPGIRKEMEKGAIRSADVPDEFEFLDDSFFSLGQGENYYETLNQLDEFFRPTVLNALRDVAFDAELYESVKNENVMNQSLLRSIPEQNLTTRLRRLAKGDAKLTKYNFTLNLPSDVNDLNPPRIDFSVRPHSLPPTNVHVLIGRNGVGKTTSLRRIITQLTTPTNDVDEEAISPQKEESEDWKFSGLVVIAFSVFDSYFDVDIKQSPIPATIVGVFEKEDSTEFTIKSKSELASDFSHSLAVCKNGLRRERWIEAVKLLMSDPLFAEVEVDALLTTKGKKWKAKAEEIFKRLSAGHSIVLLTITRLVELVDERTLVLIDEPESHLHPPLLSAFVRSLSALLIRRNGVAIIATHSPVVLQEVPRTCAWFLNRSGNSVKADRPELETFGENVGVLTHNVFGLEVTNTGFYQLLREALKKSTSYEDALDDFDEQLGSEGRAILRAMFVSNSGGS